MNFKHSRSVITSSVGFLMFVASFSQAARAETLLLNGAGATFPYPLYSKWFSEFKKVESKAEINYQSIGSGGGIRQVMDHTVDFGASDAPMTDEQLAKAKPALLHFPMVMGAVVLTYNLPGLKTDLKLTPEIVSGIFMGKITEWKDAALVAANPGVKFPDEPILVAHRSDGSGTTAIFSDWLAKVSPEWKSKVGAGPALKWPTGLGGKGNEGVTGLIKQSPGSIGYVELIYAKSNHLPVAAVKNRAGEFVVPTAASVTAAATVSLKSIPEDFRASITDAEGKGAYPISGFTYLLIPVSMPKAKQKVMSQFLQWALQNGQTLAEPLGYAPLPKTLVQKALARVALVKAE
jgi:phosphate transport system substrate-binding protein